MIELKNIDEEMMYDVLATPSFTEHEELLREYVMNYAAEKGYKAETDKKGNVYLQKGELKEGERFPCLTAHMDTVHWAQMEYINEKEPLPLVAQKGEDGKFRIFAEDMGLGGDDKAGIVICLSIMEKVDACKAVFFVEEEIGCRGSREANLEWFKDVAFVIGFDAPEQNCASRTCNGTELFDEDFYERYLVELGENYGLTNYVDHPYTDVMVLRQETGLNCMNFGAGYYLYHSSMEYVVPEEMDKAVEMGVHLIGMAKKTKKASPQPSPKGEGEEAYPRPLPKGKGGGRR